MTKDEALKLALEVLRRIDEVAPTAMAKLVMPEIEQALKQPEQEPVAWQLWVGADTPLNDPMGWQFYSTYNSLKSAEVSARTINSYQQAPFAKLVPLYTTTQPAQRILELEALLERQTARIVDLQTHIDNFDGEDR